MLYYICTDTGACIYVSLRSFADLALPLGRACAGGLRLPPTELFLEKKGYAAINPAPYQIFQTRHRLHAKKLVSHFAAIRSVVLRSGREVLAAATAALAAALCHLDSFAIIPFSVAFSSSSLLVLSASFCAAVCSASKDFIFMCSLSFSSLSFLSASVVCCPCRSASSFAAMSGAACSFCTSSSYETRGRPIGRQQRV